MDLEKIFRNAPDSEKIKQINDITLRKLTDAYPFLEEEYVHGNLRHQSLVAMANLDYQMTFPYLTQRLKGISGDYKWKGHPIYEGYPFVLTMECILSDQADIKSLQEIIDGFKPLDNIRKSFFDYTLKCLFYNEPSHKQEVEL